LLTSKNILINYLLDTHTLIWFLTGDNALSRNARSIIELSNVHVSIASVWEITIKASIGRLDLKMSMDELKNEIYTNDFNMLPITFDDLKVLKELPFYHRDPFDRILIAQALSNDQVLISKDVIFEKYDVDVSW
jgi:PIN domain nuclease of toxin-antitoxin system